MRFCCAPIGPANFPSRSLIDRSGSDWNQLKLLRKIDMEISSIISEFGRCRFCMIEYFMTKEQIQAFLDWNQLKVLSRVTLSIPLSDRIPCIDNFNILHRDTFKRAFAILRAEIREFHWRWGSTSTYI